MSSRVTLSWTETLRKASLPKRLLAFHKLKELFEARKLLFWTDPEMLGRCSNNEEREGIGDNAMLLGCASPDHDRS